MSARVRASPARAAKAHRPALFDRHWATTRTARVVGRVLPPSPDALRASLVRLGETDEDHPFLRRLRPDGTWVRVPPRDLAEYAGSLVAADPQLTGATATDVAARLLPHTSETLRVVVGPDHLAIGASHVLGDGRSMNLLLGALLCGTAPDLTGAAGRTRTSDVLRLFGSQVVRQPRTLHAAARARREARSAITADPAAAPLVATTCRFQVLHQRLDAGRIDELRRWRDGTGSSVSMAALLSALWFRAVARHGDPPDGFWFLVDTRRYGSPRYDETWGNFAQSVYLRPDSTLDPGDVNRAVRTVLNSTWPLAALASAAVRTGTRAQWPLAGEDAPGQRAYYLSHVSGATTSAWRATGPSDTAVFLSAATPAGPRSVTVQFRDLAGAVHITATCTAGDPIAPTLPLVLAAVADPMSLVDTDR